MANKNIILNTRKALGNSEWVYVYIDNDDVKRFGTKHPHSEKPLDKKILDQLTAVEQADFIHAMLSIKKSKTTVDQDKIIKTALDALKHVDLSGKARATALYIVSQARPDLFKKEAIDSIAREIAKQELIAEKAAVQAEKAAAQKEFFDQAIAAGRTSKSDSPEYQALRANRTLEKFVVFPEKLEEEESVYDLESYDMLMELVSKTKSEVAGNYRLEFRAALAEGWSNERLQNLLNEQKASMQLFTTEIELAAASLVERKIDALLAESSDFIGDTGDKGDQIKAWEAQKREWHAKVKQLAVDRQAMITAARKARYEDSKETADKIATLFERGTSATMGRNLDREENAEITAEYERAKEWHDAAKIVVETYERKTREELGALFVGSGIEISEEEIKDFLDNGVVPENVAKFYTDPKTVGKIKEAALKNFHKEVTKQIKAEKQAAAQPGDGE